jgi:hypothetical protein
MDYSLFVGVHHREAHHGISLGGDTPTSSRYRKVDAGVMARKRVDSVSGVPGRTVAVSTTGSDTSSRDAASGRATVSHNTSTTTHDDVNFSPQHSMGSVPEHVLSHSAHMTGEQACGAHSEADAEFEGMVTAHVVGTIQDVPLWQRRAEELRRLHEPPERVNDPFISSRSMSLDETKVRHLALVIRICVR